MIKVSIVLKMTMLGSRKSGPKPMARTRRTTATASGERNRTKLPVIFVYPQVADFEDALNTHLWGPLYAMLAATPYMRRQGGGRVVNIASIGGKVAVPHLVPYTTSKFALVGLSDGMRAELARDNIIVTTVCPGLMRTGSHLNALFKGQHAEEFTWFSIIDSLPISSIDRITFS